MEKGGAWEREGLEMEIHRWVYFANTQIRMLACMTFLVTFHRRLQHTNQSPASVLFSTSCLALRMGPKTAFCSQLSSVFCFTEDCNIMFYFKAYIVLIMGPKTEQCPFFYFSWIQDICFYSPSEVCIHTHTHTEEEVLTMFAHFPLSASVLWRPALVIFKITFLKTIQSSLVCVLVKARLFTA